VPGVGVCQRPAAGGQQGGPAAGGGPRAAPRASASRVVVAVLFALGAAGFAALGALYGEYFSKGPWPFYGLAAVCAAVAVACLVARGQPPGE
jgi:peptidoglycan/LPS O-acetylase OafA/YrhL